MGSALVTGARRGIGRAIALGLAGGGYDVALNDLADGDDIRAVAAEVERLGATAAVVPGDLGDLAGHSALLDAAEKALGSLTTLVNNAGVSVMSRGDLLDVSVESYDRCLDVNTRATFFLTQAFARRLLARERPADQHHAIVTISSSNVVAVSIARGEYCVSKAAVSMVSKLFAARLSDHGIGVYEVQPGFIETDMTAPAKASYDKRIAEGLTVIKRFGQPEEVGRIVLTLASGLLPYTVGQIVQADAGLLSIRY